MLTSSEWIELLNLFKSYRVRFLIVGGHAVMRYTEPRFTKDIDLWIDTAEENAEAVFKALKDFGAPLADLSPQDFQTPGHFYQLGHPPLRVDLMMSIPGVEFEEAYTNREDFLLEGSTLPFISREDLIKAKLASGRPQDLLDVENLRKSQN